MEISGQGFILKTAKAERVERRVARGTVLSDQTGNDVNLGLDPLPWLSILLKWVALGEPTNEHKVMGKKGALQKCGGENGKTDVMRTCMGYFKETFRILFIRGFQDCKSHMVLKNSFKEDLEATLLSESLG